MMLCMVDATKIIRVGVGEEVHFLGPNGKPDVGTSGAYLGARFQDFTNQGTGSDDLYLGLGNLNQDRLHTELLAARTSINWPYASASVPGESGSAMETPQMPFTVTFKNFNPGALIADINIGTEGRAIVDSQWPRPHEANGGVLDGALSNSLDFGG